MDGNITQVSEVALTIKCCHYFNDASKSTETDDDTDMVAQLKAIYLEIKH